MAAPIWSRKWVSTKPSIPWRSKPSRRGEASPEQLANDLEAMGPTYVKTGSGALGAGPDLLPEVYLKAAWRALQDKVKPFPFADVEEIVTRELGVRISKAFPRFSIPVPIAAASLGQVSFGGPCAMDGWSWSKSSAPNIRQQIADDFEVLAQIAEFSGRAHGVWPEPPSAHHSRGVSHHDSAGIEL